jgi:hypothetical protein
MLFLGMNSTCIMWTGCLLLLGYAHTHSDFDYFTGLFHSVIAYISFALSDFQKPPFLLHIFTGFCINSEVHYEIQN